MKLLDYFFKIHVKWQMKLLKKDMNDSRFSAALLNGVWLSFFSLGLLSAIGVIYPNMVTYAIVDNHLVLLFTEL